jgi:hypothetical protein
MMMSYFLLFQRKTYIMLDKYLHQSFKKIFFSRYIFFQGAVDVSEYMDQAFMVCIYFLHIHLSILSFVS